ncbi:MAG: DUF5025 domain-containing protein [Daejeonella sp.]
MKKLNFIILLFLIGCDQYDNISEINSLTLPLYSETGKNTFGCLVNERVWTNYGKHRLGAEGGYGDNLLGSGFVKINNNADTILYLSGRLSVVKKGDTIREESMSISLIKKQPFINEYELGLAENNRLLFTDYHGDYTSDDKKPLILNINKNELTLNGKRIVSGKFSGYIYNSNNSKDSLAITGGIFDILVKDL